LKRQPLTAVCAADGVHTPSYLLQIKCINSPSIIKIFYMEPE